MYSMIITISEWGAVTLVDTEIAIFWFLSDFK